MLSGGKTPHGAWMTYGGCSCHNSRKDHRAAKKKIKLAEKKLWKKENGL